MGWNIRGDRIVSDEESLESTRNIVDVVLYIAPAALACIAASHFIGTGGTFQRILIALIGLATFVYSALHPNKIKTGVMILVAAGMGIAGLSLLVLVVGSIWEWIFH